MAAGAGGCFPGNSTVRLSSGHVKTMGSLSVGDEVMTYDAGTEQLQFDPVIAFLHRSPSAVPGTQYLTVVTEYGHRLTLTPGAFNTACIVYSYSSYYYTTIYDSLS